MQRTSAQSIARRSGRSKPYEILIMQTTPAFKKELIDQINAHRQGRYYCRPGVWNKIDLYVHNLVFEIDLLDHEDFPSIIREMDDIEDAER